MCLQTCFQIKFEVAEELEGDLKVTTIHHRLCNCSFETSVFYSTFSHCQSSAPQWWSAYLSVRAYLSAREVSSTVKIVWLLCPTDILLVTRSGPPLVTCGRMGGLSGPKDSRLPSSKRIERQR